MARTGAVRTRLTHSIEVSNYGSQIAETLAQRLIARGSLPPDLRFAFVKTVENSCLLHDIGNPPFGHMGEYAIQRWFVKNEEQLVKSWLCLDRFSSEVANQHLKAYQRFDGNPQGFRIATRLQWLYDEFGMNLTRSLLAAYIKYLGDVPDPTSRFRKKIGYFPTETEVVRNVWKTLGLLTNDKGLPIQRHPLAFLMEAADDIAFCLSDIEDALEKKVVTENEFISWMRSKKVSNLKSICLFR